MFLPELGEYFRTLREKPGWNQRQAVDISRRRGVTISYNTLRWIEDGKIKNPEPRDLRALASLYGVSYEEVVGSYTREKFSIRRTRAKAEPRATAKELTRLNSFALVLTVSAV